ncbi:hypothetical protein SDC9_201109 [bioreactor metagenome]|uniref:Uncharacterized protein n=1 Tax=bioreactor metagenome TaxID=1076179 RepID=A0A645IQ10_9ZZZZ
MHEMRAAGFHLNPRILLADDGQYDKIIQIVMQGKRLTLINIVFRTFTENARQVITVRQQHLVLPEKIFNTA